MLMIAQSATSAQWDFRNLDSHVNGATLLYFWTVFLVSVGSLIQLAALYQKMRDSRKHFSQIEHSFREIIKSKANSAIRPAPEESSSNSSVGTLESFATSKKEPYNQQLATFRNSDAQFQYLHDEFRARLVNFRRAWIFVAIVMCYWLANQIASVFLAFDLYKMSAGHYIQEWARIIFLGLAKGMFAVTIAYLIYWKLSATIARREREWNYLWKRIV